MNWLHAILLGIIEGITEFLPVSSTGHLNIVEKLLGYDIDSRGMTAFTAVIQVGAIIAAILYFWKDIVRIAVAWVRGLLSAEARTDPDYTLGWGVIVGSIPVAVVGLAFKDLIEGPLRSMWVIAIALLVWSFAMWAADRIQANQIVPKEMHHVSVLDALIIGVFQALAPLFPGVSRSGATISAGLMLGFDRVTATRLSFFMGIPALVAAGGLEAVGSAGDISEAVGWGPTIIATVVSFVVAYASIAWLLRFVSKNSFTSFIVYRIIVGLVLVGLLAGGVVSA
ncbi:undecaprenyl-diphosphate phosphatase [Brachybacterium halotolerans subsp. kimchii]|uniref:Undecaprenyl-diphosphatase n=1 Tax=Brachybacterium halotolerans TaxID=2795215 RepID=A0ABS1BCD0_9MICO|nr:undecaprenyl-diphosphate phosphatase [Brachybacterium halotolerans]MBK0332308.1 undecaprenyl-diphosphate phosphatase [Brachybacterium halotolerans]MCG7308940.1 undecaprenyl-diphosphate phosphatase [Brachybacterium sp. ACRRE]UEJ81177.1 undecaprenyl-diphosphate phosphatase [Brachybacterium halotolerans subsp. kimchii]